MIDASGSEKAFDSQPTGGSGVDSTFPTGDFVEESLHNKMNLLNEEEEKEQVNDRDHQETEASDGEAIQHKRRRPKRIMDDDEDGKHFISL